MIDYSLLLDHDADISNLNDCGLFYTAKTVMVTGAGGSIGSELCRQILKHNPKKLIMFGRNENNLFHLERELASDKVVIKTGSVTNGDAVTDVISTYRPDVVLHAAANKHVPISEGNIRETLYNNIYGTHVLSTSCSNWKVKHFVLISTDKAAAPVSVMGKSKRICELLLANLHHIKTNGMKVSVVRFGNVIGSSGSVMPIFQKQIENDEPLTLTSSAMTRYFMTIPDACSLVMKAPILTNSDSEMYCKYIFDMGEQYNIYDLALKLISLNNKSGKIAINIVGIRPGEKLSEELIDNGDSLKTTSFEKISLVDGNDITQDMETKVRTLLSFIKDGKSDLALMREVDYILDQQAWDVVE